MKHNIKTIVIGHKKPDVDSISSAYAYAGLKRSLGVENVISASYGMANSFVLAAIVKMNQIRHRRIPVVSADDEYRGIINMFDLPGILSKKRQLLPELLELFKGSA